VLETDAVGVLFFDRNGTLVDANDVFLQMTGYTRADVESRALSRRSMTPPEWAEAGEAQLREMAETGRIGPYDKQILRKDGSHAWMLSAGRDLGDGTIVEYAIDATERKRSERERELLTHELSHRVKNTLAVVQAIAMQTDGATNSIEEYREKFLGRLQALGRTHGLLLESHWRGTELERLVRQAVEPYRGRNAESVRIEGAMVPLSTRQSLGLSLVLHELATNATKYGALSVEGGQLAVSWAVETDGKIRLVWEESGGPAVEPPTYRGFGTRLIERALKDEIDAKAELDYRAGGLVCRIVFSQEAAM
jgi:PAS domain S-box-containing protein